MPIALEFFVQYAYGILFLWVLVEQIGVPIPSAPLMLTAGTLTATHQLHAIPVILSVVIACLLADSLWYFAGVRYGGRVVRLICRLSVGTSGCVRRSEEYFSRHGGVTLLFAKFVPGISTLAPPMAGEAGMTFGRFVAWDFAGSTVWAAAFIFGGRFFGDIAKRNREMFHILTRYGAWLFVLLLLGLVAYRMWTHRRFLQSVKEMRIGNDELKRMMDDSTRNHTLPPFVVDLRHPLDYLPDPRVLPGALRIGPKELEKHVEILPRDRDIVLYCTCPSDETSAAMAKKLHNLGIYRVRPLKGGFDGWKAAGYPLEDYPDYDPRLAVVQQQVMA